MTTDAINTDTATLAELLAEQDAAAFDFAAARGRVQRIGQALAHRFGESAKLALEQAGKTHGTMTLPMQDGFSLKCDTKMTVKWDSEKLMAVAQTLPWERVSAIFKVAFSVPETIYKGIAAVAPELREKIDAARTTVIGAPSITITKEA